MSSIEISAKTSMLNALFVIEAEQSGTASGRAENLTISMDIQW